MEKTFDIIAVGECLIDFVSTLADDKLHLEGNPGGAPVNLLAMAAKLGLATSIITKVGKDAFGDFLTGHIEKAGIGTEYVIRDEAPTTLAIVSLDSKGDRSFGFYRKGTADVNLLETEIPLEAIRKSKVFHFGSVSLTDEPARSATLYAAAYAYGNGVTVSYDPNLRPLLWDNLDHAREEILKAMRYAHIVKISDEELRFLTRVDSLEKGIDLLWKQFSLRFLAVTLGPKGCICQTASGRFRASTFDTVCVDTTGAGDAFFGALVGWLVKNDALHRDLTGAGMEALMDFANAAGSLAVTKRGAIPAMPDEGAIERCIRDVPRTI